MRSRRVRLSRCRSAVLVGALLMAAVRAGAGGESAAAAREIFAELVKTPLVPPT